MLRRFLQFGLLASLMAAVFTVYAQRVEKPPAPRYHGNCIETRLDGVVVNAKTHSAEPYENWTVTCTIKRDDDIVWEGALAMPFPATRSDACIATGEFFDKKLVEVSKGGK